MLRAATRLVSGGLVLATLVIGPSLARAEHRLGVEVWTDRGADGVYRPGDRMEVRARLTDDAYLLVYEIDSEGLVRVLYPDRGSSGLAEGRTTLRLPSERSEMDLVVEQAVGEGFIVAIASEEPFDRLPWYLQPYDEAAEAIGYEGEVDPEEGVTEDGRIVGDPFVAMERIRRRVIDRDSDTESFSTSYSTYYVHTKVRYPRYICNDCHRPGTWSWWDGFDPYYTSCSVFNVRVNWGWHWGPAYWNGFVPYYVYSYRADCPPHYRPSAGITYSAWQGWNKWNGLWGRKLQRYKSAPPANYVPPTRYAESRGGRNPEGKLPPGFVAPNPSGSRGARAFTPGDRGTNPADRDGLW
ncbi:MAG: DUF4384 domain-containing protein, partial [Candidatus Eisenbacteria bacterium]|nr:DUF4384 domain-containing protein [Candidatus Eisenbacteria bacterium]